MEKTYTISEIREILHPIFHSQPIVTAILFGSYAKGNATPLSDVDILIDSKGKIRGIDFYGILDDIVSALRVPVDLIEASQLIEGGNIQLEIAESGVSIYERA